VRYRALASLLALCLGCGDDEPGFEVVVVDGGLGVVELSTQPSLLLRRGSDVLLNFGPDAFALGVVTAVSDDVNYDPYRLRVSHPLYQPPEDLRWLLPVDARLGAGSALSIEYPEGIVADLVVAVDDGRFVVTLTPRSGAVAFFRLTPRAAADEGFYGLGEYFDSAEHRGQVRAMQIEAEAGIESSYNEAHVPVPLLIGTRGWGWFVESPYPGSYAVAVDAAEALEAAFGTGTASSAGLRFHLFTAEHALDVTRHYYEVTGYPRLPARWALGPWVWRDESEDQAQVQADLDAIRDLDLATTGYWIDRPYATGVNSFDFEAARFPDPRAMVDQAHALGMRMALWHTPYLDEQDAATAPLLAEAEASGFYPLETGIPLNDWGRPLDFTNDAAVAWWREQLQAYADLGIEGYKLDYGEDVLSGIVATRTPWRFADGSDERTMHHGYQRFYHAAYAAMLPEDGGFLLCRAGTYGDQTNGPIVWPGDLDASFARHREDVDDGQDGYIAVGGLPAAVVAGLSLGPSGFPFFASDTGGYRHSPPDKELFMRWFEHSALGTAMQIGTSTNDVAWELGGENGFDQESLDAYRFYTRLHLRLFPYLWSYATRLADDGRPIARALGLAYPELGVHPSDTYLLGDAILVAPVIERGATSRAVTFPPGRWVHWLTGESFEGPMEATVDAPLGTLPFFVHEDGLVPLLRPTIDALAPTTDTARVDSYATDAGVLWVRAVAGGSGSFELFDGGSVEQASEGGSSTLRVASGNELESGAVFELMDADAPASVDVPEAAELAALEAAASGWYHDGAERVLYVKLEPDGGAVVGW
jgi:alpha-D-xyloside xylohydrolase